MKNTVLHVISRVPEFACGTVFLISSLFLEIGDVSDLDSSIT
jgi:hypothetical protein